MDEIVPIIVVGVVPQQKRSVDCDRVGRYDEVCLGEVFVMVEACYIRDHACRKCSVNCSDPFFPDIIQKQP